MLSSGEGNAAFVSVVIPMHNAEPWLPSLLQSITKQLDVIFEIIVVDDGSTDESANIVKDFERKNPTIDIKYIFQKNSGVSVARNVGIEHAKYEWIALVDSDDVWFESKLRKQIDLAGELGVEAVATGYVMFADSNLRIIGEVTPDWSNEAVLDWLLMRKYGGLLSSTLLIRKSLLYASGIFSPKLSLSADVEFAWRMIAISQVAVVNEGLVGYRLRSNQMHRKESLLMSEIETLIQDVPLLHDKEYANILRTNLYLRLGLYNLASLKLRTGVRFLLKSYNLNINEFVKTLSKIIENQIRLRVLRFFRRKTLQLP